MKACNSAADYNAICAGKKAGDPALRSAHALPHHYLGKGPNADGVRNALARFSQTEGLTNAAAARAHLEAHMNEIHGSTAKSADPPAPTRDLFRAVYPGAELREAEDGGPPILFGHMYRFNEWTEINSSFEGNFVERIAPGAGDLSNTKILFQHGRDPELGDKVLVARPTIREGAEGGYYEGPLLDGVPPLVVSGLRAGAYGASFRFSVQAEQWNAHPERSDYNPKGLPERTILQMGVAEGGPVTFPAYAGATAGVRSITDEFRPGGETIRDLIDRPADLARVIEEARNHPHDEPATEEQPPEEQPPASEEPQEAAPEATPDQEASKAMDGEFRTMDELVAEQESVKAEMARIDSENQGRALDGDTKNQFDSLVDKWNDLERARKDQEERQRIMRLVNARGDGEEAAPVRTPYQAKDVQVARDKRVPENIYDLEGYRTRAKDSTELRSMWRDGAMRSVEGATFPTVQENRGPQQAGFTLSERGEIVPTYVPSVTREDVQTHIAKLLDRVDFEDESIGKRGGEIARRILATGSPEYRRAFGKYLLGKAMSPEEQRALSFSSAATGGAAVVYTLDPTVVPTSNFSVNPWRALASVEQIAGTNEWKAVTSGAITASYAAEVTEASDNAPTLAQPDIIVEKAQAFIPYSIEIGEDWERLTQEMANLLQDSKDDLEATKFATGAGHGSQEPKGVITGATNTVGTTTTAAFVVADLYKLLEALPPRYRPRASFAANLFVIDKIRQFDTAGGSGVWMGPNSFGLQAQSAAHGEGTTDPGVRVPLLGRPLYEATAMASALTTTSKILLAGDFRYFKIIDRIGMNIEVVPLLVGTAHRPTGQRGLYAYWRNSSDVLSAAAFEVLVT